MILRKIRINELDALEYLSMKDTASSPLGKIDRTYEEDIKINDVP